MHRIRQFFKYCAQYGVLNTVIYSIFKLFPKQFGLLVRRVGGGASAITAGIDYKLFAESVFDYAPWSAFGGAEQALPNTGERPTLIWFVPDWSNVWGGGHFTLFRFADHFASLGTRNIIFIYNNNRHATPDFLEDELAKALGRRTLEVVVDPKRLPSADAAFATTWQSAYSVRAFNFAPRKFYFMQDYESQFYPYGTASMQAASTYSFGFAGITGGGWLKSRYEAHGGSATNYLFAADKTIFYPATPKGEVRDRVKRVFFYGRPSTERRCFELGIVALQKIAVAFPDVEIIVGGLDLAQKPPFPATLMGNMTLAQTGDLYRTCDVGIAFSATNLSYLPVELMQSGVPVLSNNGPHVEWHCHDGVNSLLVDPAPQSVYEGFVRLYKDKELRQRLVDGGLATMAPLSWESEMSKVYAHIAGIVGFPGPSR